MKNLRKNLIYIACAFGVGIYMLMQSAMSSDVAFPMCAFMFIGFISLYIAGRLICFAIEKDKEEELNKDSSSKMKVL